MEASAYPAVGYGYAGAFRDRYGGCYARNGFVGNPVGLQCLDFLAAPPEHKRIPTL